MKIENIPFATTDWNLVEPTQHQGDKGLATWRTMYFGPDSNKIRVRMVEYSAGYVADHWCSKGHILLCLSGQMLTRLADGREYKLTPGMSYQVADNAEPHTSSTEDGATLFIVD